MPNLKNIEQYKQLKANLEESKSIVVANYSGLDVASQNKLRASLSEVGGNLLVAKNRLFKIVIKEQLGEVSDTLESALNGQNAFLFSTQDAVSAIKALFTFAKDNEALEIKLSILDGKVLSFQETESLSKLPTKPELIVQLMSRLNGPAYGLVNVIQGPARGLVYALNAIKAQKEQATN